MPPEPYSPSYRAAGSNYSPSSHTLQRILPLTAGNLLLLSAAVAVMDVILFFVGTATFRREEILTQWRGVAPGSFSKVGGNFADRLLISIPNGVWRPRFTRQLTTDY
jgi:hypothetical protein